MAIEISYEASTDTVLVRESGVASADRFLAWVRAMVDDDQYRRGMNILFDFSDLERVEIGRREMDRLVETLAREFEPRDTGRVALVAVDRLGFGLARMFNVLAEDSFGCQYGAFRNREQALDWLAGARQMSRA